MIKIYKKQKHTTTKILHKKPSITTLIIIVLKKLGKI